MLPPNAVLKKIEKNKKSVDIFRKVFYNLQNVKYIL